MLTPTSSAAPWCKLTECLGKPRCKTCLAMDAAKASSAAPDAVEALIESLIGDSGGRWADDEFRIDARDLTALLRAALAAAPVAQQEQTYQLLTAPHTVQEGDQYLQDDGKTWLPAPAWIVGQQARGTGAFLPSRRPLPAPPASAPAGQEAP